MNDIFNKPLFGWGFGQLLDKLPKIDSGTYYVAETERGNIEKICKTKTFINGFYKNECYAIPDNIGTDTAEEALDLTKGCIETILREYKNVAVRIYPELNIKDQKYYCRTRLAF